MALHIFPLMVALSMLVPLTDLNLRKKKKMENKIFRIEKRGLNLMRSMQQGISTHYNTRFGI